MTKEQFVAIGLTDEQATKAADQSAEELKSYIPKTRFEEVNEAKKKAENDLKERDTQLETLKKDASGSEELKAQIEQLQKDNKTASEKAAAELKEVQMNNAIKLAIAGKVHDENLVTGLFDKTKLILGDDGKVTGLDEQLTGLKTKSAFLFKEDKEPEKKPGFKLGGGEPGKPNGDNSTAVNLKDAIASYYQK